MELYLLIAFPLLILMSAVFSSAETAYFSLSNFELSQLEEEYPKLGRQVRQLLESPDRLLSGILMGNMIVNIGATAVATILLHELGREAGWSEKLTYLVAVIGMTLILLVFGEVSPKVYAMANARKQAMNVTWFIRGWLMIFRPVIGILVRFNAWFKGRFASAREDRQILEEELKLMVDISAEQGDLEQEEKTMIHNIFELSETMVREIMVPRTDILGISLDTPLDEVVKFVQEMGHSRYPVYEGDLDNLRGILYAKDLLDYSYQFRKINSMAELLHEIYYVPEAKRCGETLRDFQKRHQYMGIVVDEYGGTEGLVTVEDIMEEIIGEIQDEHDEEEPLIVEMEPGQYLVDGKINIEDLSETLGVRLEGEGYESLGGYILSRFGRLPHAGEFFEAENYRFTITKLSKLRIWKVRIDRLDGNEPNTAEGEHFLND
ncbi:MAG: hypothetical protein A3F83_07345 [Candidatus Glassbacteria bacterium RIFCSPLOWO2_12_FULL_58_11]|uniref:Hemolysin n=2 Tax=Candidatus Glassiibacteriota TaxID=1817805 RepID=A0A1F5YJT1_9BACT|nr:MAG: hypothetical protein A2Z86_08695 [Candidatus Glassbacteria bacterium GWA2_58_10]OGG00469.1 MAG: hypothetical protein A3F83_07345 [Candidatus Glassbacteria bacterium RIFCSPLOWO2_12_FULL_58_11]